MSLNYRYFYLADMPYSGSINPPFAHADGTSWSDSSSELALQMIDAGVITVANDADLTPIGGIPDPSGGFQDLTTAESWTVVSGVQHTVGLWQWTTQPFAVGSSGGQLVVLDGGNNAGRLRAAKSAVSPNSLQLHFEVRLVKSDGTLRQTIGAGELSGAYGSGTTPATKYFSLGGSALGMRIYDGDALVIEVGIVDGDIPPGNVLRTLTAEMAAGTAAFLANPLLSGFDAAQADTFWRLYVGAGNLQFHGSATAAGNSARYVRPIHPTHKPVTQQFPAVPNPVTSQSSKFNQLIGNSRSGNS